MKFFSCFPALFIAVLLISFSFSSINGLLLDDPNPGSIVGQKPGLVPSTGDAGVNKLLSTPDGVPDPTQLLGGGAGGLGSLTGLLGGGGLGSIISTVLQLLSLEGLLGGLNVIKLLDLGCIASVLPLPGLVCGGPLEGLLEGLIRVIVALVEQLVNLLQQLLQQVLKATPVSGGGGGKNNGTGIDNGPGNNGTDNGLGQKLGVNGTAPPTSSGPAAPSPAEIENLIKPAKDLLNALQDVCKPKMKPQSQS